MKSRILIIFLLVVSLLSICMNALFLYSEFNYKKNIKEQVRKSAIQNPVVPSSQIFTNELIKGSCSILDSGIDVYVPTENISLRQRIDETIHGYQCDFNNIHYRYSEMGFLMIALLENAKKVNNVQLIEKVKECFDKNILEGEINYNKTDWCIEGYVAILLYDLTKDNKYKEFADKEYRWLLEHNTEANGILYIPQKNTNFVDGVGIFNPFLVYYSTYFYNVDAYKLACSQIDKYCKYGVDIQTGLPSLGYSILPPYEKQGSANWGRGCAWFALGLLMIDKDDLLPETRMLVDKFNNTLVEIWKREKQFTQFIGQEGEIDLSATLPLLYYLYKKRLLVINRNDLLIYSTYMADGVLWHSSGACRYPGGPYINSGSSQRLSQAFMLKLLNEVR